MIVPPFIPPPVEIPGAVADQSYLVMVRFVRRLVAAHFLTVLLVAGLAQVKAFATYAPYAWAIFFASLVGLSVVRGCVKGRHWEMYGSAMLMPVTLASLGVATASLSPHGVSPWWIAIGPACATLYVAVCGRDLSFLGMLVFAALGQALVLLGADAFDKLPPEWAWRIVLATAAYLVYFVYDLATLTRRRRSDEALGAVIDLYRDALNFLAYPIRVWNHWQKHRIWAVRLDLGDAQALAWRAFDEVRGKVRRGKD